ncbi:MAG: M48 family metalloprotease [Solimonas sp.]
MNRALTCFAALCLSLLARQTAYADDNDLPDMGSPASAVLSLEDEYRLGSMVVRGLRDQGQIMDDPELNDYIESIGLQISSQSQQQPLHSFQFYVVKDPEINAFALPGGFVCVNSGLFLSTRNENELAGVLGHEISHITQRHIARSIIAQKGNGIVSAAAMLAAILLGAAGGGDAAIAGVAAAQTVALQNQMSFSRSEETEADNHGVGLVARAGFDPNGMWQFFQVLEQKNGGRSEAEIPAMLRNHPVTSERIAETRARAEKLKFTPHQDSISYQLMRERLRVLMTPSGEDPREYYPFNEQEEANVSNAKLYGKALAETAAHDGKDAVRILKHLLAQDSTVIQYHTALGQAQLEAGDDQGSIATLKHAMELFPRNIPVTISYAQTLMRDGDAKRAHMILLDLFNNVAPTPDQAKLIALAANAAGDSADAYSYMGEYYIMGGDLPTAVAQYQMALAVPNITPIQRERFRARLEEIQRAMPRKVRYQPDQGGGRFSIAAHDSQNW